MNQPSLCFVSNCQKKLHFWWRHNETNMDWISGNSDIDCTIVHSKLHSALLIALYSSPHALWPETTVNIFITFLLSLPRM